MLAGSSKAGCNLGFQSGKYGQFTYKLGEATQLPAVKNQAFDWLNPQESGLVHRGRTGVPTSWDSW